MYNKSMTFWGSKKSKENDLKVTMATEHNEDVAKSVGKELGLDDYCAEVLSEDKQKIIWSFTKQRGHSGHER